MTLDFYKKHDAVLLLEDGRTFTGFGVGSANGAFGEVCVSTGMVGYQHTITDPSFAGQIISFTFPHIGNVGINDLDFERDKIYASGVIMREVSREHHHLSKSGISEWLSGSGISGICGVDTRAIASHIRDYGHKHAHIIRLDDVSKLDKSNYTFEKNDEQLFVNEFKDASFAGTDNNSDGAKIVIVDFGSKSGIIAAFRDIGCSVEMVYGGPGFADRALKLKPDGIVLSNGPGDPAVIAEYASAEIKTIIDSSVDIFGICMGHQLLASALEAKTVKMKNGHRGANHPVIDLSSRVVEITSQNHGYVVDADTLPDFVEVTHISLFDKSIEGIKVKGTNTFSVQYHPEGSPGTNDSKYLFKRFIQNMK